MIIAITCVVAIAVIAFILGVRPKDLPPPEVESPFAHFDERKASIYENLRDLQFEYRVGKLSDEDYQATKKDLQKELAGVLGEVDKLKAQLFPSGAVARPVPVAAPRAKAAALAGNARPAPPVAPQAAPSGNAHPAPPAAPQIAPASNARLSPQTSPPAVPSPAAEESRPSTPTGASGQEAFVCDSCGAGFERDLKFCGECGKPMKVAR